MPMRAKTPAGKTATVNNNNLFIGAPQRNLMNVTERQNSNPATASFKSGQ
jgi:hypothetical protein